MAGNQYPAGPTGSMFSPSYREAPWPHRECMLPTMRGIRKVRLHLGQSREVACTESLQS